MSSDKQASAPIAYQPQPVHEDEISLVDIVNVLLRRKKLVLGITAIAVCIGLLYAFTKQRVYKVETIISPPGNEIIQSFNLQNLQNITKEDIYSRFTQMVTTRAFQYSFFNKFNVLEALSEIPESKMTLAEINEHFESFSDSLNVVKKDKKDKKDSIQITLEGVDKDKLGARLDDFIEFANHTVVDELVNDIQADINYKIKDLKLKINYKRLFYNQRRKDELKRLQENYQIAKELGIIDRSDSQNKALSKNNLSIYMNSVKRYMDGTKILQAEINALKNRKSDDIHIAGLRDLQENLIRLEALNIEKGGLHSVIVDKKASVDVEPIRPKRILIVLLSLILGGMLGIFAVFTLEFISDFKRQADRVDVA